MSDSVEISVTHEIYINNGKAWIKVGLHTDVLASENHADAIQRASKTVAASVLNEIERQAQVITDNNT